MSDSSIWSTWLTWVFVVAVVILAAAALLLLVNMAAVRILKLAVAALGLVKQIKDNTACVWALEATNKTAVKILDDAKLIRAHGALVAQALHDVDLGRS
jgi:hypothetical protein